MKEFQKYIKKWQNATIKLNEAIQKHQFNEADELMNESKEAYEAYKACVALKENNKGKTFGVLNAMLEESLTHLFQNNKKALRECTNFIKNNPTTLNQFKFINTLKNYNCNGDAKDYVNEALGLIKGKVNSNKINTLNEEFGQLLAKYEIGECELSEAEIKFYEACNLVLSEEKNLKNIGDYTNAINNIATYITENKKEVANEDSFIKMTESLSTKIDQLNENDKACVEILLSKENIQEKEDIFNKYKTECLAIIDEMLTKNKDANEIASLETIKEGIINKQFKPQTVIEEIIKLIEVKELLK